jgi:hypothetical protein
MQLLHLLTLVTCVPLAFAQDGAPNFSGIWRLNVQKSHLSNPAASDLRAKIDQNGPDISVAFRVRTKTGEEIETHKYRIGSDDNRNTMHGAPMKSSARWDGGALVIDSTAKFGDRELRLNDRWTLSADGQTLTFVERHQFGTEAAAEDTHVLEKQANATWEPPEPPKPIEQAYKNIQVLKGIPSTQLMPIMMAFTRGLSVKCDHCHVPNEFDKDDKPAKNTARQMLKMVMKINADNFGGGHAVGCWTCHRGSIKPEFSPKE